MDTNGYIEKKNLTDTCVDTLVSIYTNIFFYALSSDRA